MSWLKRATGSLSNLYKGFKTGVSNIWGGIKSGVSHVRGGVDAVNSLLAKASHIPYVGSAVHEAIQKGMAIPFFGLSANDVVNGVHSLDKAINSPAIAETAGKLDSVISGAISQMQGVANG